ncbi:MAG: RteC domain-containing protein [Bacteroidetes bacterium]|nr:RteC domain-containing protein [Bacteroidota bacterium]
MDKKIATLYEHMTDDLEQLAATSENILQRAEQSYRCVEKYLAELKEYIISYTFGDKQEEVHFFKHTKPLFLKELLYHMEIFQVEAWKSPVGRDEEIAHYKVAARRVDLYFKRYNDLYTYFRTGSSIHDERYFVRDAFCADIAAISVSDMDARFSTVYSFQFAKMQAYEEFADYLYRCVQSLENPGTRVPGEKAKSALRWTDSKADLIELSYGLYARGAINHGKADIKQIITALEAAFNVSLGNFYRTFQNLRIRKKNRTPFWDAGKEDLIKCMDSADLNY